MLEGYDENWRKISKSHSASFSDLKPGSYNLKIYAANSDLIWNEQPLQFRFILKPPLWMTPYAYAFYLLVIVFIIQLVINYRVRNYRKENRSLTEKAMDKKRIEAQRSVLSRINQNLTDSITYATRIQAAMIPTEKRLRDLLPNSFVYFRPRDLVSGDFYYLFNNGNKTFIAVVDCTGHGVPGAFMSIIGMDLLKSIIEANNEDNPARILELMNLKLAETFATNGNSSEEEENLLRDGMDMGICVIDHEQGIMEFAGAVNEVYIIRSNEITSYKGSRTPLGRFSDGVPPEYKTIRIGIQPLDMVYLFSDGYVDQFGGTDLKKFKYRRFRHLLLNIHKLEPNDQKAILHQKLEEWRGIQEQVDDIVVLGFSPFRLT
jgi:serine phosphatase RsbU (regulator of sigma subunit)